MARARRRSARGTIQTNGTSPSSSRATSVEAEAPQAGSSAANDASICPGCTAEASAFFNQSEKENWIRCDVCKAWYHWHCASTNPPEFLSDEEKRDYAIDRIDKWYCPPCLEQNPLRKITLKRPTRKSDRKRTAQDYASLSVGLASDPTRFLRVLDNKEFGKDEFRRMQGNELTLEWLEEDADAMTSPVLIEKPDGLGMKMPGPDFTVDDVAQSVGVDSPLEVIDVATQSASHGWTLGKWAKYIAEPDSRDKIYNVISLEVTGTKLGDTILPPQFVRDLDWVDNFWPNTKKGKGHAFPKVQLYCLMGVAKAWTDWHVDFAGSSVYYHILRGSKVFYFIKPTAANLAAYEKWSGTELQNSSWLGDMVDQVIKVVLTEGNTMIIPSGWIHAVYTPVDTIVFGGNFLHSFSVPMQLKIRKIEINTHVPKKFRFPLFCRLCWYVGDKYFRDLKALSGPDWSPRLLSSLLALADFLVSEVRMLETGSEAAKKEMKDQVPADRVKDPAALARELRWRLRIASGILSDDEGTPKPVSTAVKRRREGNDDGPANFKHFRPRRWDNLVEQSQESDARTLKATQPSDDDDSWKEHWMEWSNNTGDLETSQTEAEVKTRTETIIRIRRNETGLERQRVERVVEYWRWH